MHRNPLWIALFLLVVLIALFFLFKASMALFHYAALSESADGKIERVEILERKNGKFVIWARYSFFYQGKRFEDDGQVGKPFLNRFSAEKSASRLYSEPICIYFDPRHPANSAVNKRFPLKSVVSALVLCGLAIYFFILGRFVARRGDGT